MFNWIQENWVAVAAAVGALHAVAKPIVQATETKQDDKVLAFIYRLFTVIGIQPKGK